MVISNRHLKAEAYNTAYSIRPLEINFQAPDVDWKILENPFRVNTVLQFSETINGPLRVFDQSGRLVWQTILDQANSVIIQKTDLGAAGTYFFNVTHQGKSISGQFISLD